MKVIINSDNFLNYKIIFNMWKILIIMLFILSIYITKRIKCNNFKLNIKELIKKDKTSLFLTLGTKVGVGSIIGTTASIIIGGFQSVIWIIIFSISMSSIIYYESYLGKKYRKINNNNYIGGPYFILKFGLKKHILSIISLFLLIVIYCFLFQMIQLNTISNIILLNINIKKEILVLLILIIFIVTINLSIKSILEIMNKIVPIMCIIFIFTCLFSIINNIDILCLSFKYYFIDLFSIKALLMGLVIGVKRSIFMNEILIGTTSISSSSDTNDSNICMKYQVLGIYFISIVITTLITSLLLIYLYNNSINNDYIALINNVFYYTNGKFGIYFLLIIFILFGFTTILSGYYIGKNHIEFITKNKEILLVFKILFIFISILGIFINNSFIWKYLDYLIFIMIIINSYSIIKSLGSDICDRE